MCPAYMEQAVPNLTSPRVYYSAGDAGARWVGLNSPSKQADYQVPDFEKIGVWTCLATALEQARILQTGQNVVKLPSHAHCTRFIRA